MTGSIKPVFYQFDQSRTEESKNNYHLSLQISIDGFCFALFHLQERKYIGIGEYVISNASNQTIAEFIDSIFADDKWLKGTFKSVTASFNQYKNTLIPSALFEEGKLTEYLSLNTGSSGIDQPKFDRLLQSEIVNCYSFSESVVNVVLKYFPATQFFHQNSTLIESSLNRSIKSEYIQIQFNRKSIDLVAFKNNKLQLQNSFEYKTSEDVIYFLLYVMEQLGMGQETTEVYISGSIVKESNVYNLLYRYIKEIKLLELPNQVFYSQPLRLAEPHQYYLLIQQYLCA